MGRVARHSITTWISPGLHQLIPIAPSRVSATRMLRLHPEKSAKLRLIVRFDLEQTFHDQGRAKEAQTRSFPTTIAHPPSVPTAGSQGGPARAQILGER